jgi:hypothetical protein
MTIEAQQKDNVIRSEIGLRVVALLERKREIADRIMQTNRMESDHGWLMDAVELLLRLELLRHQTYDAPLDKSR